MTMVVFPSPLTAAGILATVSPLLTLTPADIQNILEPSSVSDRLSVVLIGGIVLNAEQITAIIALPVASAPLPPPPHNPPYPAQVVVAPPFNPGGSAGSSSESVSAGTAAVLKHQTEGLRILAETFPTRNAATLALMAHSTSQMHKILQLRKSGSNYISYRCQSCVKKGKVVESHSWNCGYFANIVCSSAGSAWKVGKDTTLASITHSLSCPSSAKVSKKEVVKQVTDAVDANSAMSGKNLVKLCAQQGLSGVSSQQSFRAKTHIIHERDSDYEEQFSRFPEFCKKFEELNPGSKASYSTDTEGRFKTAFVSFKPSGDVLRLAGLSTHFLDGAHSKHYIYAGLLITLIGRDSNNNLVTLAVMLCDCESTSTYSEFGKKVKDAGFGDLLGERDDPLDQSDPPLLFEGEPPCLFGDRDKGMNAFFRECTSLIRINCVWHMINNVYNQGPVKMSGTMPHKNQIWKIAGAENEAEYTRAMKELAATNGAAAAYLGKIDRKCWVNYSIQAATGAYNHNYRTNGAVESSNNKFMPERHLSPLYCFEGIITKVSGELQKRRIQAANLMCPIPPAVKPKLLTPSYNDLLSGQLAMMTTYKAYRVDGELKGYVCYKDDMARKRMIDIPSRIPVNVASPRLTTWTGFTC